MKLKNLYKRTIEIGIQADPRDKKYIDKILKKHADRQKKLEGKEKEYADAERTWNPYSDSRILNGTGEEEVQRLMIGIDIEPAEMLLADRLRERGEKIDCVMIHHPEGRALADLEKVMSIQADVYHAAGVPVNQTEALLRPRQEKIWRAIHADNFLRTERTAELLGIPAFTCHTVTDNLVWRHIEKAICQKPWDDLSEIINALHEQPEYDYYARKGSPAIIVNGSGSGRPGKIVATGFTGGTNGPEELMEQQAAAGVGTILCMHFTEKEVEIGRKNNLNMIQCNHMASDAMGINLLLDILMKEERKLDVLSVSGFVRVKRK
jgi:hypothetical protein